MKRFLFFVALVVVASLVAPFGARAGTTTAQSMGAGPHGYDWLVGTWSCTNSIPSPGGGPKTSTFTSSLTDSGAVLIRVKGAHFDETAYIAYAPKTKSWSVPSAFSDGSYELETSTQSGPKVVFAGTYYPASGASMKVRDTFTEPSTTKETDLGEFQAGGSWKTLYNISCTKT